MIRLHAFFERRQAPVHVLGFQKHFGRAAPHHHHAIQLVLFLECADVFAELLGQIEFRLALLYVRAVQVLHVILVEHRLHRLDALQKFLGLGQVLGFQHAGLRRGLVCVVAEYIPAAEHDVVEFRQLHKIFNLRRAAVSPLTQPDRSQLRQRAHRHRMPSPHQFHARHESRAHRAHSGRQHSQLSLWRGNTHRPAHSIPPVRFVDVEDNKSGSREKIAPPAAKITPPRPRARGASRKLRFVSCAADELFGGVPAPRRKKRSEQTIYDAAMRGVLQIDFPSRRV